jgi:hypothetical protein
MAGLVALYLCFDDHGVDDSRQTSKAWSFLIDEN